MTALLFLYPIRTLLAEYCQYRASSILRSRANRISVGVTEQSIPNYLTAIRSLEIASFVRGSKSGHQKAISELYLRIGIWTMAMETMNATIPEGLPSSKESYEKAEAALKKAIRLEPTNPDYHFALGALYDIVDKYSGLSGKELERAILAYPINTSLRYAVALQHLNAGRRGDALEHATALAGAVGDSFSFSRSLLFKAFEIGWRATNDSQVVQGLSPDDPKALKVLQQYLKWKGVDNEDAIN